jgi:uncharacterized tellurite resistance protein B-like protein
MFDKINKFFGNLQQPGIADKIQDQGHDVHIATCALFLEMASIDGHFSDEEQHNIIGILKAEYDLSQEHIAELMEAAEAERRGSIDLWHFTNSINQNYSIEEKIRIIELIWKVVYSDGKLDKHEDYLVHKIARLLKLQHSELIAAKLKVIDKDA